MHSAGGAAAFAGGAPRNSVIGKGRAARTQHVLRTEGSKTVCTQCWRSCATRWRAKLGSTCSMARPAGAAVCRRGLTRSWRAALTRLRLALRWGVGRGRRGAVRLGRCGPWLRLVVCRRAALLRAALGRRRLVLGWAADRCRRGAALVRRRVVALLLEAGISPRGGRPRCLGWSLLVRQGSGRRSGRWSPGLVRLGGAPERRRRGGGGWLLCGRMGCGKRVRPRESSRLAFCTGAGAPPHPG